jgi:hypothetical protein
LAAYPGIVWCHHVDRFAAGVADIEIVWQSMTTWLELKFLQTWSTTPRPLVSRGLVTPLQARFLLARERAGIRAYAYIGFIAPSGALAAFEVPAEALRNYVLQPKGYTTWRHDAETWLHGLIGPK